MSLPRLKGQQVEIRFIKGGKIWQAYTNIVSYSVRPKLRVLEQGFLGETTNRHDEVFDGATGNISFHCDRKEAETLIQDVIDRAKGDIATFAINIVETNYYPGGDTVKFIYPDVKISDPEKNASGRGDYVTLGFTWSVDNRKLLS